MPVRRCMRPRRIRIRRAPPAPRRHRCSSAPSALIVIVVPRAAASSRMPMMLLPSISRASRATRTCAWNRVARWTNFAAARACMPSWFTTVTLRDVMPAARLGSFSPRRKSDATQMALRPWSRISRATASRSDDRAQARQLDQHRQVDAGDDLEAVLLEKGHAQVRRRAAEHVGQQQHAFSRRGRARWPARCPRARRSHRRASRSRRR